MRNDWYELEVLVLSQSYDITDINETRQNASHDWSAGMETYQEPLGGIGRAGKVEVHCVYRRGWIVQPLKIGVMQ